MELMLLRHADAAPIGPHASTDEERPLTDSGHKDALTVGKGLGRLDLAPELVLTSPLLRARQTAEALAQGCGPSNPEVRVSDPLAPGATPARAMQLLEETERRDRIALVGHQPDIGRLLSFLISGGSMELEFSVRPATVCVTTVDGLPLRAPGRLVLFAQPSMFSAWAGAES